MEGHPHAEVCRISPGVVVGGSGSGVAPPSHGRSPSRGVAGGSTCATAICSCP